MKQEVSAKRSANVKQAYLARDLAVGEDLGAHPHSEDV